MGRWTLWPSHLVGAWQRSARSLGLTLTRRYCRHTRSHGHRAGDRKSDISQCQTSIGLNNPFSRLNMLPSSTILFLGVGPPEPGRSSEVDLPTPTHSDSRKGAEFQLAPHDRRCDNVLYCPGLHDLSDITSSCELLDLGTRSQFFYKSTA